MKTVGETACKIMYNGWKLIREDLGAATPSSRFYVWGLDLSGSLQGAGGVGGLLAMLTPDSCLLTPAYDANGNISEYVDTNGTIVAHYEYDAFGNEISRSGAEAQSYSFRFSTKYTDDESGLVYYGYRFYSPGLGRWVNRDPIGELGGVNVYGFVGSSPIVAIDIIGLAECKPELINDSTQSLSLAVDTYRQYAYGIFWVNVTSDSWTGLAACSAGAWYVLYFVTGDVEIDFSGSIICASKKDKCCNNDDCVATYSSSGEYTMNDGVASVGVQANVSTTDNIITVNFSVGIAQSGSNAVGAGVGSYSAGITFPGSGVSKSAAGGSATWRCVCK